MMPPYLSPVFNHLWQSTLFAALAALLVLTLRRNSAHTRYSLWLIASLKFLVPFSLLVSIGSHLRWSLASTQAHPRPSVQWTFVMEQISQPFAAPAVRFTPSPAPALPNLLPWILLAAWICGLLAVVFTWWIRWRRIRAVVTAASPVSFEAPVPVLASPALLEPGVFGIFRPVLLLPSGITDHLAAEQLDSILAHEFCHVRRRDNLASAVHMLVQAVFWFHPLVWWIGARLVDERERACDEEVLRLGSQPQVYAESILKTCQFYLESPLACMSGVTGSDLKKRIVRIMTAHVADRLDAARKLLLTSAAITAVAAPVAFGLLNAPLSRAQSQPLPAPPLSFEVASVRLNTSGGYRSHVQLNNGRITATNFSLRQLIEQAYQVRTYQISGPSWLNSVRFDIAAKSPADAPRDQLHLMLRPLLAERFKLAFHHEEKVLPVFALVIAKGGPKIQPVESDGHTSVNSRPGHLLAEKISMPQFAEDLSHGSDRPVVDATDLKGSYNFTLEWTPDDKQAKPPDAASAAVATDNSGPSLFTAIQEQLGLKLEPRKAPVEILVIDHIEKTPTEN